MKFQRTKTFWHGKFITHITQQLLKQFTTQLAQNYCRYLNLTTYFQTIFRIFNKLSLIPQPSFYPSILAFFHLTNYYKERIVLKTHISSYGFWRLTFPFDTITTRKPPLLSSQATKVSKGGLNPLCFSLSSSFFLYFFLPFFFFFFSSSLRISLLSFWLCYGKRARANKWACRINKQDVLYKSP